jgi:hypothetical protein
MRDGTTSAIRQQKTDREAKPGSAQFFSFYFVSYANQNDSSIVVSVAGACGHQKIEARSRSLARFGGKQSCGRLWPWSSRSPR